MSDVRPNPDHILRKIRQESDSRGRLKIFFGYAAGVGKTYAMLDAAHAAKESGVDVVIGYVEPHQRPETSALLDGLPAIEPLFVEYKGITLREFDLDAALKRKPQLIIVDELAHTNAQGCRHLKRYNDIEELLSAGIDVYTTVNVQHLESLNDIIASITGVVVQERIPDSVFDRADQVELVDIEPDDLIERLNQGKIYRADQAKSAVSNFFTKENLIALREIALRRTADRVVKHVGENSYVGEHILICLSSSPSNNKVIRTAARMASAFHAQFTALFVETPHTRELNGANRKVLRENLKLAESLGAKIATVYGENIPFQIAEYAKVSGVTKIVIGRSNTRGRFFTRRPVFVEQLTQLAPNMDVHIIPDSVPKYRPKRHIQPSVRFLNAADILKTAAILILCTLAGLLFYHWGISEANIITIYILGVLLISNQTSSRFYGIISSVVGVLAFNFLFTHPRFTLNAYGAEYPLTFLVMLASALITSTLTIRVKKEAKMSAMKAYRTEVLLETSKKLQRAETLPDIVKEASEQLLKLLDKPVAIYLSKDKKLLPPDLFYPKVWEGADVNYISEDEQAVAAWSYQNKKPAGAGTDTLPGAKAFYLPVQNQRDIFAVIAVGMQDAGAIEPFERSILIAMTNEIALTLEKFRLDQESKEAYLQIEREKLRSNLLRAISHDLRTPLTTISGNANMLLDNELDAPTRRKIYEDIYEDALWLINLVENLLSVTRIDNGTMSLNLQTELISEVIEEALTHISRKKAEHHIKTEFDDELLMARVDSKLIIQVIINIVDNAIKYTPSGSAITIKSFAREGKAVIEIADDGDGIAEENKEHLFDMFFTVDKNQGDSRRGLGLGLSLCRSIVEAHGGEIYVKDNQPRGTIFGFTLKAVKEVS